MRPGTIIGQWNNIHLDHPRLVELWKTDLFRSFSKRNGTGENRRKQELPSLFLWFFFEVPGFWFWRCFPGRWLSCMPSILKPFTKLFQIGGTTHLDGTAWSIQWIDIGKFIRDQAAGSRFPSFHGVFTCSLQRISPPIQRSPFPPRRR